MERLVLVRSVQIVPSARSYQRFNNPTANPLKQKNPLALYFQRVLLYNKKS